MKKRLWHTWAIMATRHQHYSPRPHKLVLHNRISPLAHPRHRPTFRPCATALLLLPTLILPLRTCIRNPAQPKSSPYTTEILPLPTYDRILIVCVSGLSLFYRSKRMKWIYRQLFGIIFKNERNISVNCLDQYSRDITSHNHETKVKKMNTVKLRFADLSL